MDVPVRSRSASIFLAERNFLTISPELLEILEGELLGDGSVVMNGNYSARYSHSSKYEEYLIWLSDQLAGLGIEQVGKIYRYKSKGNDGVYYFYGSKSYPELITIRERWYPRGKKIVPKDLELTPMIVRQWYIGDGSLKHPRHRKHERPNITLATCGFDKQSVEHLIGELKKQGFIVTHQPSNNVIGLSSYSVQDFLSWIGPCPVPCYDYKWNYKEENE